MDLLALVSNHDERRRAFPVVGERLFMAHAGVSPLPAAAADALHRFADAACRDQQEAGDVWPRLLAARKRGADLLGCSYREIALLGPTSLGLNLVANGLAWEPGDEIVYYREDYPANVYPWTKLASVGVRAVSVEPEQLGAVTWEAVEAKLTDRTRLVALASCSYLAGYRIDLDTIGRNLHRRGILFCVDGIQTLGAFPVSVDHVDFLCADSHKWMLGPVGAGIFFVSARAMDQLGPTLLGAANVLSPEFVAQDRIELRDDARRYEPGSHNVPGILGMLASMELLLEVGVERIAERILLLRRTLVDRLQPLGFRVAVPAVDESEGAAASNLSGILSVVHPDRDLGELHRMLTEARVSVSLRKARDGRALLRFSPHFYNTEDEIDRLAGLLRT